MKFICLFFIGFFAATSATTELDLFEGIPQVNLIEFTDFAPQGFYFPEKVKEAIEKALDEFNILIQKFKTKSVADREKLNQFVRGIKARAEVKIQEASENIKELVKKGGRVSKCAIKYDEELINISNGIIDGLKECSEDIVLALKELTATILGYSDEFIKSVNNLRALSMKCYNEESKIAVAKCIATNISEFTKLFGEILDNAKATINGIYQKSKALVEAATLCNNNHIETTFSKVKAVKAKIDECVKLE
ncbi:uncharacterized protein LOC129611915 [Condylostylus longicornis]|uniref:uncharacterized protein LOC129611915 n=1 Tax=Condylostylus longicornis TaxID=2530218 RepID=UPI00244DE117|nr:uncharacterized protein LOC129611915 [Condylostylus longicornis]